jgi:peptidoglycan/LPS O-acetylase OafA/YrhL
MDRRDRVYGLDILRCIAILFVLFAHSSYMLPASEKTKDVYLIYFGSMGVEIFFVLSGFLVGRIFLEAISRNSFSWATVKHFWIRRWFRTLPAYYLAFFTSVLFAYLINGWAILSVPSNYLYLVFLQNFFTPSPSFFGHGWSLSVEEWFYLLLPFWVGLFMWWGGVKNKILTGIVVCIVFSSLLRIVVAGLYNVHWNQDIRRVVPFRLDSLMVGVLTAYLCLHYNELWKKYAVKCMLAGLFVTVIASVWLYYDVIRHPDTSGFLTKTLFFNVQTAGIALCMPYMSGIGKAGNKWIGAAVTHISIISYSLYLFHIMIMYLYLTVCYKLSLGNTLLVKYGGAWAACIIASTIIYYFYEKPCTNLRERFKRPVKTT